MSLKEPMEAQRIKKPLKALRVRLVMRAGVEASPHMYLGVSDGADRRSAWASSSNSAKGPRDLL